MEKKGFMVRVAKDGEKEHFVMATSPKAAAASIANDIIPSAMRWGASVYVTRLTHGETIDWALNHVYRYRISTSRIVNSIERMKETS